MRLETIRKRLRLSTLPEEAIQKMYSLMLGKSDKSTKVGGKYNLWWIASVFYVIYQNKVRESNESVAETFEKYAWPMP